MHARSRIFRFSSTSQVIYIFVVLLFFSSGSLYATERWHPIGPPGGSVRALAIDPLTPTTLYAGTWAGGVFRSTDSGDSWIAVNDGLANRAVVALAIDPLTPTTLYAGTYGGGVFRSMDSGDSWTEVNDGLTNHDVEALAIDPLTPSTLYAGIYGYGIFRSTDAGDSWIAVNDGLTHPWVDVLEIDPLTASTLYAGTDGYGVFRSMDSGDSWTAINDGLANRDVEALAIDPLTPSTLYAGTLGGGVFVYRPDVYSFFFPQFADGTMGALQLQSTLILANSGGDAMVRVELYRSPDGEPMKLSLGELGTDSVFEFEMKEGESISLSTPGTGELQVGYARIVASQGVGGVVVFQRTDLTSGIPVYEAGVPASKQLNELCLFVDSLGVRDTGLAIVYPPEEEGNAGAQRPEAHVTLRLYDKQYNFIAERSLDPMAAGTHMARFVHEMFDDPAVKAQAQEMEGILVVQSDQPLVAVTLRQNDDPAKNFPMEVPILTTFPVIPGAPPLRFYDSRLLTENSVSWQTLEGILDDD